MVSALELPAGARILEPSAGLGRLLDALIPCAPGEVVAVEMAVDCARVLFQQDRPGVTIRQQDFLTLSPNELGTFDAVIMNPLFQQRSDIQHILHARWFLKPGGTLAALCMAGPYREKVLRPLSTKWQSIPAGTFREAGTCVETVLLTLKN